MVRYCRECNEEFQPQVARCSDCGAELVDRWFDDDGKPDETAIAVPPPDEPQDTSKWWVVARQLLSEETARAARRLTRAGIAFRVLASGYTQSISVRDEDLAAAEKTLGRLGERPPSTGTQGAVGQEGGPCPACGAIVSPGSEECPGCGLCVGSRPDTCPDCDSALDDLGQACARCGWSAGSPGNDAEPDKEG